MTKPIAVLTNVDEYGGPAALSGLIAKGIVPVCHSRKFVSLEARAQFEQDHLSAIASSAESPEELVGDALERFERIDAVIANDVGNSMRGPITDRTASDYRNILDDYAVTPFRLIKAALPTMLAQGSGQIVLITSGAPLSPRPGIVLHSAARAATHTLVTALAAELGPQNISVNAIAPIYLLSHLFPGGMDVPAFAKLVQEAIPMQRFGEPEEMAELVGLLASGKATFVSGQVIAFSGGAI
jgi:NAD(P)-dependent dehydrogenase (short-subunit alcohol dehydrogenase family)